MDHNCSAEMDVDLVANMTEFCSPPQFDQNAFIRTVVLSAMALLSLMGNMGTVISIVRRYRRRRSSFSKLYSLLLQLTIADLLVTVWCIAGEAAWTYTVAWLGGNILCKAFKFAQVFSLYLSTFILVLIGADHLQAVRNPLDRIMTGATWCNMTLWVIWIVSAILAVPQLFIFRVLRGPFQEDFYQCVTYGYYSALWQEKAYAAFSVLSMFILPLAALAMFYSCICLTISQRQNDPFHIKSAHANGGDQRLLRLQRAKTRSLRMSMVIVLAFILCWTPYYVMMSLLVFFEFAEDALGLKTGIFFFGMSNSVINPIIYGAFYVWRPRRTTVSQRNSPFSGSH